MWVKWKSQVRRREGKEANVQKLGGKQKLHVRSDSASDLWIGMTVSSLFVLKANLVILFPFLWNPWETRSLKYDTRFWYRKLFTPLISTFFEPWVNPKHTHTHISQPVVGRLSFLLMHSVVLCWPENWTTKETLSRFCPFELTAVSVPYPYPSYCSFLAYNAVKNGKWDSPSLQKLTDNKGSKMHTSNSMKQVCKLVMYLALKILWSLRKCL